MSEPSVFTSSRDIITQVADYYDRNGQKPFLRTDLHDNWKESRTLYKMIGAFPANAFVYYYQSICASKTRTETPIDGIYLVTPQHAEFATAQILAHLYQDSTKSVFCALVAP